MERICNKKILANSLLEWTLGSSTTFFNAEENKVLAEKAAKLGIELPSPDLAAFETIYCEVDKFNLNGVRIPKKVAEKGIKTLIGKQVNWNHEGAHQICGYIIDSFIKDNKIYIDGILFKSLFKTEFDEVMQLFAEGKLFVSFELWNRKEDGSIIIKDLGNGQRELTEMVAHGCALLLIDFRTGKPVPPACPKAQVQKLLASEKVIHEAEEIVNSVFEKDERLVYAELATATEELKPCSKCSCFEKEVNNIMPEEILIEVEEIDFALLEEDYKDGEIEEAKKLKYEERQKLSDDDFAVVVTVKNKVTGEPRKIRMFPIQDEAHVRNALARLPQAVETLKKLGISIDSVKTKIIKKAKELNMTDLVEKYEKSQVTNEPAQVTNSVPQEQKLAEQAQVVENPAEPRKLVKIITEETVTTTEIPDENGRKVEKNGLRKQTYFYSDGTEEVFTESFEVVNTYTQAQLDEKLNEFKAEYQKKLDKKEVEIANLKTEAKKVSNVISASLEVGNVEESTSKENQDIKDRKDKINEIIASKHEKRGN